MFVALFFLIEFHSMKFFEFEYQNSSKKRVLINQGSAQQWLRLL